MTSLEKSGKSFLKLVRVSNNVSLSSFCIVSVLQARLCNHCGEQLQGSVVEVVSNKLRKEA